MAVNLRISRAFGIGPKLEAASSSNNGGGPGGGPASGGGGRWWWARWLWWRLWGGGRGMMGGSANTGHKYSLSFSAQALNLFNDIDRGQPIGTVNSPNFGQSKSLATECSRQARQRGASSSRLHFRFEFPGATADGLGSG